MSFSALHVDWDPDDLPDAGEGMCCMGAAARGPSGCTCWDPEYTLEQSHVLQLGPPQLRERMCEDCAFRTGSPEQRGDASYAHSGQDELGDIIGGTIPFVCHQGMRRRVRMRHPAGAVIECGDMAYDPPINRAGLAYKADGTPADICAGWAAKRAALLREA